MKMQPYRQHPSCLKCGDQNRISTRFHEARKRGRIVTACRNLLARFVGSDFYDAPQLAAVLAASEDPAEHLLRVCTTCGYRWTSAPADDPSPLHKLAAQAR